MIFSIPEIVIRLSDNVAPGLPDKFTRSGSDAGSNNPISKDAAQLASTAGNNARSPIANFAAEHTTGSNAPGTVKSAIPGTWSTSPSSFFPSASVAANNSQITKVNSTSAKASSRMIEEAAASTLTRSRSSGHNGGGTFYSVGQGACGKPNSESEYVAAISCVLYEVNANNKYVSSLCGQDINAEYEDKSVTVKIVDCCESCGYGDLGFSPAAFSKLANKDLGVINISWNWTKWRYASTHFESE